MSAKVVAVFAGMLLIGATAPFSSSFAVAAEPPPALVQQVTALDDAAMAAYSEGDTDKMQAKLMKAVALGKDALAKHPIMARVYLHLGVLHVDGLEDRPAGVRYFAKALSIRPDIEVRSNMATKTVMSAFQEASHQEAPPPPAPPPPAAAAAQEREPAPPPKKAAVAEPSEKENRGARDADQEKRIAKAVAAERQRVEAEASERARVDREKALKDVAQAQENEAKERGEKERMKREREGLIAEAKQQIQKLEKENNEALRREKKERDAREKLAQEKAEKDALLLDTAKAVQSLQKDNAEKDKAIAAAAQREKKEREAKEKLDREKQDRDRQLADLKQRMTQLEKDKAEKEKLLAATTQREAKEREGREKLERDKQAADAHDKERKAIEDKQRIERDKVEAGPELPGRIPEPLFCALPEEVPGGIDLFVQCVAQPQVKAKTIVFYFRPANATVYNAIVLDPTKRGWSRGVIPGYKVAGKLLQYYVEARDTRSSVVASNGKPTSPNIVTVGAPRGRR